MALVKALFGRLDNRLSQCLGASELSLIESDYFGHVWRDRPSDLWECMESWPPAARQEAVNLLRPMMVADEPLLP
jgi:hypothetical protein